MKPKINTTNVINRVTSKTSRQTKEVVIGAATEAWGSGTPIMDEISHEIFTKPLRNFLEGEEDWNRIDVPRTH